MALKAFLTYYSAKQGFTKRRLSKFKNIKAKFKLHLFCKIMIKAKLKKCEPMQRKGKRLTYDIVKNLIKKRFDG